MGLKRISYDASFNLSKPHQINFLRIAGFFEDRLQVRIDGHIVLDTPSSSIIAGKKQISYHTLDGLQVEIWWRYNLWGDPKYIALVYKNSVLAKYGQGEDIDNLSSGAITLNNIERPVNNINELRQEKVEILGKAEKANNIKIISREDYPIDNRNGSRVFSAEYKISKTITTQLKLENKINTNINFSSKILDLITVKISADLSTRIEQGINETITCEHNLNLSVEPGDFVIYTIVWKCRTSSGEYIIGINKEFTRFNYEVQFGLSYSLESRKGA